MRRYRFLFGAVGAAILTLGIFGLAFMVPGYSQVRQTVSEIGEMDSPARIPFAGMLCCVAVCILVFASAVRDLSIETGRSRWAAYLIGFMAIPCIGIGIFAYPHPLHNVFGLSELIGYQAPLAVALTWRGDPKAWRLVTFSWVMFALMWCAIVLNLSSLDRHGAIWAYLKPTYGLAQRALFATWFGWCAAAGVILFQQTQRDPLN